MPLNQLTPGSSAAPQASNSIIPEVVDTDGQKPFEELTEEEERERLFWERKVERAFYEAGKALKELRDRRLYRSTHPNFESYCQERFGFRRRHPYQLIDAATVVDNLLGEIEPEMCADRAQNQETQKQVNKVEVLPTKEYQVRPLVQLNPVQQREAWQQAVEKAEGKVPSNRIVKDVVQRIRDRHPVPNPYRVGEVCTILVKENPDWRGYGGCWAIVTEVHEFSCTVKMWDGLHQVRLENLKELLYSEQQQEQVKQLGERLSKIPLEGLEKPVRDFLAGLGKLDRPWLTALEEGMLQFLEDSKVVDLNFIASR